MPPSKRPLIIGVTGNIGSGKSTFCKALEAEGLAVYYADLLARNRLDDPSLREKLVERFGNDIIDSGQTEGRINRQRLAEIVFRDEAKLQALNALLHPLVLRDMDEIVAQSDAECLIFEVPLLFEAGLQDCFDFIILVYASAALRHSRIVSRDGKAPGERGKFQIDDEDKQRVVDLVVTNNGSGEELKAKALEFVAYIPLLPKRIVSSFYRED